MKAVWLLLYVWLKTGSVSEICFRSGCNRESCLVAFICMVKTGSVSEICFSSECIHKKLFGCFYMYGKNRKCQKSVSAVNVSIKSCLVASICMVKTESVSEISFSSDCIRESCLVASVRMVKNRKCQ